MSLRIPTFFIVILIASFFVHLFVYFSVLRFFSVTHLKIRIVLFIVTLLLSLSFIASIMLVRAHENLFSEAFYILSALWIGLLINLMLASAAGWAVLLGGKIAGYNVNMGTVGVFLFLSAFFYSVYGAWNAQHPVIKNIEVEIKNLPQEWKGKTVVQLSDVHLGVINRAGFFEDVVGKVNSLDPEAVFITGDLFDGMAAGLSAFVGPLNEIKAREGIFFVTGNHEVYQGLDKVFSTLAKTKIRVLNNEVVRIGGLQIVGVSYPLPGQKRDIRKIILSRKDFREGMPMILLYHVPASIDQTSRNVSEQQRRTYFSPDVDFTAAKGLGAGLQLSGHTHKGQMFPFGYLTRRVYNGYDYGLHSDGDFSIYTTCGVGTWGPPLRTGNTPEIVAIRLK